MKIIETLAADCKVCGSEVRPFGRIDFNRSCEDVRSSALAPAGYEIPYVRCVRCGLIFTSAFDQWSTHEFSSLIYNEEYILVDPDFIESRPRNHATMISTELRSFESQIHGLDYGGGNGLFAKLMQKFGFNDYQSYDPLIAEFSVKPEKLFNLITCFETLEHLHQPISAANDISSMLDDQGIVFFSTMIQPENIRDIGTSWWYIAPRNGHITIYTKLSLNIMWRNLGFEFASFNDNYHVAYKKIPDFGVSLLRKARPT